VRTTWRHVRWWAGRGLPPRPCQNGCSMGDLRGRASERRQLTVLFCDVVDSTGLSERHDPEDLREVLLEFQTICSRCIKDAGGTIVNYIGDGIRAEFGYPQTSENEAASAVRAGLLLLRGIQELNERSTATFQEPLRVRIGVHTGVAVIGKGALGHVHDATEIVGDTPNIAARLQEIGEPNSLVISGETQRLLRGKFPLRMIGMRALKGLSRKIEVFQVVGEAIEEDIAHRRGHHNASPLIGRVAEFGPAASGVGIGEDRTRTDGGDHRRAGDRQVAAGAGADR
jgi:class 3 adenylate cyclase